MLAPPSPLTRERILAIGSPGSGKTTAWLSIAFWAQATGSDAQFYVLDTDFAARHMLLSSPKYGDLTNVHVYEAIEWEQYTAAIADILPKMRPQDWLVVDFMGSAWDAVQEWYVAQVFKDDIGSFFMQARKGGGEALDGWRDWGVINRVYKQFANDVLFKCPGQLFTTAVAEAMRDTDDRAMRSVFGPHGVRPRGQKHLAHGVHTVLLLMAPKAGEVMITTVKDRERAPLNAAKLNDFAVDYLVNVAGWDLGSG